MVRALCCLHNWLIDKKYNEVILESTAYDQYYIVNRGGMNMYQNTNVETRNEVKNNRNSVLLDGGGHFDDTDESDQYRHQKILFWHQNHDRRKYLLNKIQLLGMENRHIPIGLPSTSNN